MVKEIELKFRIESYREFILKLLKAGALFENSKYEVTIMYDENNKLFEKDARLRLRKKFDVFTNEEEAEISYKKPLTREGIKIEEEYETKVENFKEIEEILTNIGFKKVSSYERVRDTYRFEEIKITVDSFSFGDYVELEGDEEKIKNLANNLQLNLKDNITKSYDDLYAELCILNNKEIKNHISFNGEDLKKEIEKRIKLFFEFKRNKIAKELFKEENKKRVKLINFCVEILKRNSIGKIGKRQTIIYDLKEATLLIKICKFLLFLSEKECQNFGSLKEKEILINNLLRSLQRNNYFLIFGLFCPSYKKVDKGFKIDIGETTKNGIYNLSFVSKKANLYGIKNKTYAIFCDLALEEYSKLTKDDFIDIENNFLNFKEFCRKVNSFIEVFKISEIGKCKEIIGVEGIKEGALHIEIEKLEKIVKRSLPFYKNILGWKEEKVRERTEILCRSCSKMTEEIKKENPECLMIMAENIYERGCLYYPNSKEVLPIFYPKKINGKIARIEDE